MLSNTETNYDNESYLTALERLWDRNVRNVGELYQAFTAWLSGTVWRLIGARAFGWEKRVQRLEILQPITQPSVVPTSGLWTTRAWHTTRLCHASLSSSSDDDDLTA